MRATMLGRVTAITLTQFLVAHPQAAAATREITIDRQSGFPVILENLGGSSGNPSNAILKNDLENAGLIRLLPPPAPGSFVVGGSSSGGRIDGELTAPDGSRILKNFYNGPTLRGNAHRFADDIVLALTGKPGIASGTIAFVSNRSGYKEILLCDADGSNVRPITHDRALAVAPSISPDGGSLAYTGYKSGYADIYLVDLVNGSHRRVIHAPGTNSGATIAPDGRRIALTMSFTGNTELYISGTRGGRGRRLTKTPGIEASPAWSPDGRELIYAAGASGRPQLYRIKAAGGNPRRLSTGFASCTEPDWSPDGQRLAFNVLSGGQQIAVLDFNSGKSRIITRGENPSWGADSRHLVFTRDGDLVILDTDSGHLHTIVSNFGRISEPSWSH